MRVLGLVLALSLGGLADSRIALTFEFGATDQESTQWDGELICPDGMEIEEVGILDMYPPRNEVLKPQSPRRLTWRGGSKREVIRDYFQKRPVADPEGTPLYYPLKPYTFTVQLVAVEWGNLTVRTAGQGEFTVDPAAVPYGQAMEFLEGRVRVVRSLASIPLGTCLGTDGAILYNDFPAVGTDTEGAVWTAYVAYHGRPQPRVSLKDDPEAFSLLEQAPWNDQLLVVHEQDGTVGEAEAVTAQGLDLFRPALACGPKMGPLVVWSQQEAGNWDLYASARRAEGWLPPVRLTTDAGPDLYAALAVVGDVYWLAWQGARDGVLQVLLAPLDGGSLEMGTVIKVTDGTANSWMPALAVDSQGTVTVAYDTYEKGDYDVFCRQYRAGRPLGDRIAVADSLRFEARASVAYDAQDRLWIAWEEAGENWGKDAGGSAASTKLAGERIDDGRTLRLACLENGELRMPAASLDSLFPLQQTIQTVYGKPVRTRESVFMEEARYAYYPRLAAGRDGRLYLGFRQHDYLPDKALSYQTIWSDRVVASAGDSWLSPVRMSGSDGHRHAAPALCALPGGGVAMASAGDGRASRPRQPCETDQNVRLGRMVLSAGGQLPMLGEPIRRELPSVPPGVAAEREAVQRLRDFRVDVAGTPYRILRGDFHRHTAFSGDSANGDGCIDDAFRYALDAAALDTMGNGDHDNGGGFEYPWYVTQKFYDLYRLPDHFTPMFSYERSVTANGPQGHRNIIMPRRGVRVLPVHGAQNIDEAGSIQDTRLLFGFLRHYDFVSIPHTIATGAGANFVDYAPDVDSVVEIYQGARNAYEFAGCPRGIVQSPNEAGFYRSLLKAGKKYGVIASSDHRSTHCSYAMFYVPEPTRESVMEALRRRHCYAATDNILVDFRSGTHLMGDEFASAAAPTIQVLVVGTAPIKTLEIVRNAEPCQSLTPGVERVELSWTDPTPLTGETNYYLRVVQEDGELAWSSPLWIRPE
jgi:hypothetical protein